MFDEPSYNALPIETPKPKPPVILPPPEARPPEVKRFREHPFWLQITVTMLGTVAIVRLCTISVVDNPLSSILQWLSAAVMGVVLFGILRRQQWAARFLLVICLWSVISTLLVTVVRFSYLDEIENTRNRQGVLVSLLRDGFISVVFYGLIGGWYIFKRKAFYPTPKTDWGNIPYVVMLGILLLFTVAQVVEARANVLFREEAIEEFWESVE